MTNPEPNEIHTTETHTARLDKIQALTAQVRQELSNHDAFLALAAEIEDEARQIIEHIEAQRGIQRKPSYSRDTPGIAYSMLIEYSPEDLCYYVTLPEWIGHTNGRFITHGKTYEEAARMGQDCLESLIEASESEGDPMPEPAIAKDDNEDAEIALTPEQLAQIEALKALPDDQIDTSDIPEITDFTGFQRGLFYRRGTNLFGLDKFTEGIDSSIDKFIERGEKLRKTMPNPEQPRYSMLIQWSNEDNAFIVKLPEWQNEIQDVFTHGDTYEEAAKNGRECLEFLVKSARELGEYIPDPDVHISEDEADEIERKWDELLASPESQAHMEKMAAELDADREAGRLIPGGFNGRGEFTEDLEAALKALISRVRQGMMMCDQEALATMINEALKSGDKCNESMEK